MVKKGEKRVISEDHREKLRANMAKARAARAAKRAAGVAGDLRLAPKAGF